MRKNKVFITSVFLLIMTTALILSGCSGKNESSSSEETKPLVGYLAPNFKLNDIDGNTVELSELCGNTIVVNFWSLSCPYCLREMPDFEEVYKSSEVEFLMINVDKNEDQKKLPVYIENQGYTFRVLKDEKAQIAREYMIRGLPTTFIIDPNGKIIEKLEGAITKEQLKRALEKTPKPRIPS